MLRAISYVVVAWLLLAAVPAIGAVAGLTLALPSTTAILLVHLAYSRPEEAWVGLSVAVAVGYLEDVHQGSVVGVLCAAHALTFLAIHWSSRRLTLPGVGAKAFACGLTCATIDALTFGILWLAAERWGLRRESLISVWPYIGFRALTTALLTWPLWSLLDYGAVSAGLQPAVDRGPDLARTDPEEGDA